MTRRWRERTTQKRRGHHAPDLWSVWAAAPLVLAAGAIAVWLLYLRVHTVAVPVEVPGGRPRVDSLDVIRTTLSVAAFVGALLAGLYAYRKQRLAEGDAARADAAQFSDRYTKTAEQLGSDKSAIRLAGVYAMARLADDWHEQRQTCIDVLCAYLRMPYILPGQPGHRPGQSEVRATIVRVIVGHLRPDAAVSWSRADFDFTAAHLENVNFSQAIFLGAVRFDKVTFTSTARFSEATFASPAWFAEATFHGTARFANATFASPADFADVTFSGLADFAASTFSGTAWFDRATFSENARFEKAIFAELPELGEVTGLERTTGLPEPPSLP